MGIQKCMIIYINPLRTNCQYNGFAIDEQHHNYNSCMHALGYEAGIKTIQFYMKSSSNVYITYQNT